MSIEILSQSVEETIELGRKLGSQIKGGTVIALIGNLGTGKTHMIKGMAEGLEVLDPEEVTSPTFTLINEYEGRLPVYHIDAYRFDNEQQLEALGFDEICQPPGVVIVEWADKVRSLVDDFKPIVIQLSHQGPTNRGIIIESLPEGIVLV